MTTTPHPGNAPGRMENSARWLVLAAAAAIAAGTLACGGPAGSGGSLTVRLSIATGGTGGVYYPYGGGIAKVISDNWMASRRQPR